VELVTLRLRRIGRALKLTLPPIEPRARQAELAKVVLSDGTTAEIVVHDRQSLAARQNLRGSAMIADPDSTVLIPRGWTARVTNIGGIIMERQ